MQDATVPSTNKIKPGVCDQCGVAIAIKSSDCRSVASFADCSASAARRSARIMFAIKPFAVSGCADAQAASSESGRCSKASRTRARFLAVGSVASKMPLMMFKTPNV